MRSFKATLYNGFFWRICYYASAFALNVLIAHYLGAAKSGVFYLLLNNLAFVVLILSIGIDSAIGYFNARKELAPSTLLNISFGWSIISLALLWVAYQLMVSYKVINVINADGYLFLYIAGSLITTFLSAIIFSLGDNKTPGITLGLSNILLLFFLPTNPLIHHSISEQAYTNIYLSFAFFPAIVFALVLWSKKIYPSFTIPKWSKLTPFFRFALQSFAFSILYVLLLRCDYWIVNYYCTDADLGNYLQASKLNQLITLVPTLLSFTLFPLIVSQVQQQQMVEIKVVKLAGVFFYIGLFICIGISAVGYWIFPLIYGNTFLKIYPIFILLSPGILFLATAHPFNTFFAGKNLVKINIISISLAISILLICDFILVPSYNIYGAAIGSSAGYLFYFICLLYYFKKNHPVHFTDILNLKKIIEINKLKF